MMTLLTFAIVALIGLFLVIKTGLRVSTRSHLDTWDSLVEAINEPSLSVDDSEEKLYALMLWRKSRGFNLDTDYLHPYLKDKDAEV